MKKRRWRHWAACCAIGAWIALTATVGSDSARAQVFEKQAVACQDEHGAASGAAILAAGGNAVDAAIATALALAATHPAAGNLGGGGFIVAYLADRGAVVAIDFREKAPMAATERMYLDDQGKLLPRHRAGPRAAGVPGTPRGLELASKLYGRRPWAELVQPAIRLARDGFPVSRELADSLNSQVLDRPRGAANDENPSETGERLADFPASVRSFRKPNGEPWRAGDVLKQPDLAATLERLAQHGANDFYQGRTAELIVRCMKRDGGLITLDDLKAYEAKPREPVKVSYRGHEVYGMAPPSSGGVTVGLMLNILSAYDLKADGPSSVRTLHRVTEAMKRAYCVRAVRLADPDFVDVPVARLLSPEYARELASSIGETATPSQKLVDFPIAGLPAEGEHTTHLSTIDANGGAVALTYTLEEAYGSKAVVDGAGFLLNNEMGDFNLIPGRTDAGGRIGGDANLIRPGKRMLSSMSPTIVLKDGKVRMVTGSPGGRTIPNTVLWNLLRVLEFGQSLPDAVKAPRTHHAWFPDVLKLEGNSWNAGLIADLSLLGHKLQVGGVQGDAHSIAVDPDTGRRTAAPDPRRGIAKADGR